MLVKSNTIAFKQRSVICDNSANFTETFESTWSKQSVGKFTFIYKKFIQPHEACKYVDKIFLTVLPWVFLNRSCCVGGGGAKIIW